MRDTIKTGEEEGEGVAGNRTRGGRDKGTDGTLVATGISGSLRARRWCHWVLLPVGYMRVMQGLEEARRGGA